MNVFRGALALALMAVYSPAPAAAEGRDLGIAAAVGGDAISSYDVENRLQFVVATARLSRSPDVLEKIRPQIIRSLIDEKLQMQEALKRGVKIGDAEVEQAIAAIEQQRNMPPGAIYRMLDGHRIPRETFTEQIRTQLAWSQLLSRKVRPQLRVSDAEIALASRRFTPVKKRSAKTPEEFKIAAITLPIDKPSRENDIRRLAEKLVKEIRGGANFEEVSRQFSSGAASSGGRIETFWVKLAQLDPRVGRALAETAAGGITGAVLTNEGYTIVKVYDTRSPGGKKAPEAEAPGEDAASVEVSVKEILLRLEPDADKQKADAMIKLGEKIAASPGGCDNTELGDVKGLTAGEVEVTFRRQPMAELPAALRIIAENLKPGDISTPFATYDGIRLYLLCEKKEIEARPVNQDEIRRLLLQQKMELEAQKYLRDLRRETFIDIRSPS